MPVILRPTGDFRGFTHQNSLKAGHLEFEDATAFYKVGAAYIYGIMLGEVKEMCDRGEVKTENIYLI